MSKVTNRKVLMLSAAYEPLGIRNAMEAFLLVYKGSAECVPLENSEPIILHSQKKTYEISSVIRIVNYYDVRSAQRKSGKQRGRIFMRDKYRCQYCCKKFSPQVLTLDHIIPQSQGGEDAPENLATSCKPCNQRKGPRTPDQARMPLLATPSALRYGLDRAMMDYYAERRPEWAPYLYKDVVRAVA